ncbi:helix-turn-helix domain-containing protein [Aciduricibacillus chroicocephali]|uniref:Helix-turn-helix domain-containing protein n=1 Tax=Aciduricibacillus chroicocephali TaxID=3054939 RepID=A0ABY9KYT1_9BACI|nr:helix-turn-helix domain-containing protein [Bacillaceae bacterium 44XB]
MDAGKKIGQLLHERGMSMRSLARRSGIDAATISRLVKGERRPTLHHLKEIAACFDIPVRFFVEEEEQSLSFSEEVSHLLPDGHVSMETVEHYLKVCQKGAATVEGRHKVMSEFLPKLEQIAGQGSFINRLKLFYQRFSDRKGTKQELVLMGGVLLYFIMPYDAIPDYLFPIGYLDDALAAQLVARKLSDE